MAFTKEHYINRKKKQLETLLSNHLREHQRQINSLFLVDQSNFESFITQDDNAEADMEITEQDKSQLLLDIQFLIKEYEVKIGKVKEALLRIQKGNYLECRVCSGYIPAKQLNNSPTDCQCASCKPCRLSVTNKNELNLFKTPKNQVHAI